MRLPVTVLLALALVGCKHVALPALSNEAMIETTVQIKVVVTAQVIHPDGTTDEARAGWVGSGVVYRVIDDGKQEPRSLILTANHVLETPKVGDTVDSDRGPVKITGVDMSVMTEDGRTCDLKPLVLGESTTEDVATGVADCVAGRPAYISSSEPDRGDEVYVSGHPAGFENPVLTQGVVGGWYGGYVSVSAPAWGGNSGGPVFYHGRVIGLLVRGSREYPLISLVTPLQPILDRIAQTDKQLGL
jgi:S1-C subfamily serine protease